MREKIILILIFAFFLRFWDIQNNPPALYGDELTLVYDAYSIYKTGRDSLGNFLPLTFSLSEGRPPLYVYLSLPLVAIFGPNELSARLLSVLAGIGIVWLTFLLGKKLFSPFVGLVAALFLASSPWGISLSRGGFEANLGLFLMLLGIWTFFKALEKPKYFLLSAISFGLTIHTYHSYKATLPLFALLLVWFTRVWQQTELLRNKLTALSIILLIFFIGIWLVQMINGKEVRLQNTSIFNQEKIKQDLIQKINEERTLNSLPTPLPAIFHNKLWEYSLILKNNYLDHFSFRFLFLSGDGNPRHNPATTGQLYLMQLFLISLALIWFSGDKRKLIFLLGWILIAPVPSAIVTNAHAIRSLFMLPPLIILSALGLVNLWIAGKTQVILKLIWLIAVIGLIFQFVFFVNRYYFLAPNQFGTFWSKEAKEISFLIEEKRKENQSIVVSNKIDSIEHALPVYLKIDPQVVIAQNQNPTKLGKWVFKKYDNLYLGDVSVFDLDNLAKMLPGPVLYIGGKDEILTR